MRLLPGRCGLALALAAGAGCGWAAPVEAGSPGPAAASAAADDPGGRALDLAREIIRLGYPEADRPAMFNGAVDASAAQTRTVMLARFNNDPAARAIMDRSLDAFLVAGKRVIAQHIPAFMNAYAIAYARTFPVAELEQILAFVQTPAGAHFLQRSPRILADPAFAAANQDYLRDLQPLMEQMRTQIMRDLLRYYGDHPPKASTGS